MAIVTVITAICYVLMAAIFIRAIMSFVTNDPRNPLVNALDQITEPILAPLRRVIPRVGAFDFTPMIAIFILLAIVRLVNAYYS
jgi:YggT family protein